jgi:hypothetical protein
MVGGYMDINKMELASYRVVNGLNVTTRLIGPDCIVEFYNMENQRHRDTGPAVHATLESDNNKYYEWWNNGQLIGVFNRSKNACVKSKDGTFETLYKVQIPEKWKNCEDTITLEDMNLINS